MLSKQLIRVISILPVLLFISMPSYAENGFGAPFANHAPAALGGSDQTDQNDDMNAFLERLSDIEPAAGEEEPIRNDGTEKVETGISDFNQTNTNGLHGDIPHIDVR